MEIAIGEGIDTMDSCYPTRVARHGTLFTSRGVVKLRRGCYEKDFSPLDENCDCLTCTTHTKAYLHHLLRASEPLFSILTSVHNLQYWSNFMVKKREQILNDEI